MSSIDPETPGSRIKSETQELYDAISPDFDRTRSRAWPETVEFVSTLNPPGIVLDLGCGNGKDSVLLKKAGFCTVSVDISKEQCNAARKNLLKNGFPEDDNTRVVQGDCEDLNFPDETFDHALFLATLHHLATPGSRAAALIELKRVLKKNGRGFISVWDFAQPRFKEIYEKQMYEGRSEEFGDAKVPWKATDGCVYERFYHLFLADDFRDLVASSGFQEVQFTTSRGNHFAVVKK